MKLAYICGPFRAPNAWEIEENIRRAEVVALKAWKAGFAVICPHTNTRFFDGAAPDEIWLNGDLEIMKRCDLVILVEGWDLSLGALKEIERAEELGIPVFHDVPFPENFERFGALRKKRRGEKLQEPESRDPESQEPEKEEKEEEPRS